MAAFKSGRTFGVLVMVSCLVGGTWLTGCTMSSLEKGRPPVQISDIKVLLVTPVETLSRQQVASMNQCPICNAVLNGGPIASGAADYMTRQLMAHLKAKSGFTLLGPGMATGIRARIISSDIGISRKRLLVEMGRQIDADAVVSGVVYRFRQRVGTKLGVDSPASVGFGIHFVRCSDGRLIWSDHFDETQRDLSENLFRLRSFVKRGGHWLTAERLAAHGLREIMADFPVRK